MKFSDDLVRMLSNIYDGGLLPKKLYSSLYSRKKVFQTLHAQNWKQPFQGKIHKTVA